MSRNEPSVLVIGAGVSGLTAAKTLLDSGFTQVTVMEADSVIGGRVRSMPFGSANIIVEQGAHWLHSMQNNPLLGELVNLQLVDAQMAKEKRKSAEKDEEDYFQHHYFFDNEFPDTEQEEFQDAVDESMEICEKTMETPQKVGVNREMLQRDSMGECMNQALHRWVGKESGGNDRKRLFLERCKEVGLNILRFSEGTDQLEAVSYNMSNQYDDEGGDWRPPLVGGFSSMIQAWAQGIGEGNILLNHAVTKLTWTGDQVQVQFQQSNTGGGGGGTPLTRSFDHVIVTCSLDFLKKHHDNLFEPKLPAKKVEAFNKMSLGDVEKVFIELSEVAYPVDVQPDGMNGFSVHATPSSSVDPLFHGEHSFYSLDKSGKYFFTVFLRENAKKVIALPKEELSKKLQEFLATMVNKPNLRIVNLEKTDWSAKPFILGSYSHIHPKTTVSAFNDIVQPLVNDENKPMILFAGEHTHEFWYSAMHGAYGSAKRAAKRLMKLYRR